MQIFLRGRSSARRSVDGHARSIIARKRGNLRGGTKYVSSDEADNERSIEEERGMEKYGCADEKERERKAVSPILPEKEIRSAG